MKKAYAIIGTIIAAVVFWIATTQSSIEKENKRCVYAVLPLTGPIAQLGKTIQGAMQMYLEEHPYSRIDVVFVDSASVPDKALSALNAKTASKDNIIVVSALSSVSSALIPFVSNKHGFLFPILTVAITDGGNNNCYQRFSMGTRDIVDPIATYARENYNTVSILYANEDYGLRNKDRFVQVFSDSSKRGSLEQRILSQTSFDLQDKNVREIVSRIVTDHPEAIYITGNGTATYINLIKSINEVGFKGKVLADASFSNPFVYKALGNIAERVLFTCANSDLTYPQNKEAIEFRNYCQKHEIIPYGTTSNAYDVLGLIDLLLDKSENITASTISEMAEYVGSDRVKFTGRGDCEYVCTLANVRGNEIIEAK